MNKIIKRCLSCEKEFITTQWNIDHSRGKFCSSKCSSNYRKNKPKPENEGYDHAPIKRICETCGKEFKASPSRIKYSGGKYCSPKCAKTKKIDLIKKVCLTCGKEFKKYPSVHGKYCSRKCYGISRSKNLIFENSIKICPTCEKEFYDSYSRNKKYCSKNCQILALTKENGGNNHKIFCQQCGEEFIGRLDRKFCSKKCWGEHRSEHIIGINNPNYSGGHNEYCEKWTKKFKKRIIAFFGDSCIECGEIPLKTLRCHHVYYDKKACCAINESGKYFSNLNIKGREHNFEIIGDPNKFVPLCERCHNKTHGKNKREYWARHFEEIVNNQYGGKSYYTKEEYELIQSNEALQ